MQKDITAVQVLCFKHAVRRLRNARQRHAEMHCIQAIEKAKRVCDAKDTALSEMEKS